MASQERDDLLLKNPVLPTAGDANTASLAQNSAVPGAANGNGTTPGGNQTGNVNNSVPNMMNLAGVSDNTRQTISRLTANGYQPSGSVSAALDELNRVIATQPQQFQSQFYNQLTGIMNQILGRQQFSYDPSTDPLYQQYRQQYMRQGRQAMEDTMGRAATLTGGYGNSYASTAGNQAYQQYMTQLNDRVPELYNMALSRYQLEGDRLKDQYDMLNNAYNDEYGKWQDQYNRWLGERDYSANRYDSERDFDYGTYNDQLNYWTNLAAMENSQYNQDRAYQMSERDYWYQYVNDLVAHGNKPSDEVLMRAGLSWDDIAGKLKKSSSGSSSSSNSSNNSQPTATEQTGYWSGVEASLKDAIAAKAKTSTNTSKKDELNLNSLNSVFYSLN